MNSSTGWTTVFGRLSLPPATPAAPERFNPRPPSVLRFASASHAVLLALRDRPGVPVSRKELIESTGCSRASIGWAIDFLCGLELVTAEERVDLVRYAPAGAAREAKLRFRLNDDRVPAIGLPDLPRPSIEGVPRLRLVEQFVRRLEGVSHVH